MNCPFCLGVDLGTGFHEELAEEHSGIRRRVLAVRSRAYLAAGLGALVYPYALYVTRRHVTGIDETSDFERTDLFSLLDACVASRLFDSPALTLFEHGGSGPQACSCVDHCHVHIVDGQFDLLKLMSETSPNSVPTTVTTTVVQGFPRGEPYLWAARYTAHDRQLEGRVRTAQGEGQQYFRRLLAGWVRSPEWNWRTSPRWENVDKLVRAWPASQPEVQSTPPPTPQGHSQK